MYLTTYTGADPWFFFRRRCTTEEWCNWLMMTRRKQILIDMKKKAIPPSHRYPYAPTQSFGAPSPPPPPSCINWHSNIIERQTSRFKCKNYVKAFTYLRYWYHYHVQSQKDVLCVCLERVLQTNLSWYNPCHSRQICISWLMCPDSAANWSVTVANPMSDK